MMLLPHSTFFVILNLFQDNKRPSRVVLERRHRKVKQVQHDDNDLRSSLLRSFGPSGGAIFMSPEAPKTRRKEGAFA